MTAATCAVDDCELVDVDVMPDDCWGKLTSLSPLHDDIILRSAEVTVGRGANCTHRIADNHLSSLHCKLYKDEETDLVQILDLSTNGTYVNGNRLVKGKPFILDNSSDIMLLKGTEHNRPIQFVFKLADMQVKDQGGPFDKYTFSDTLGTGNFATVKRAYNMETGELVAVKIIDRKKMSIGSSQRKDAMKDEITILEKVTHPNIISIREVFETPKCIYIVLELVTGGELYEFIVDPANERGCGEAKALELFGQMLDAVHHLHAQGIAHRDLKPENILLKSKTDHTIKLSDFGLSRSMGDGSFMKTRCGTPQYLAPEVLTKEADDGYGLKVDTWALGVILYILLCGEHPFDDSRGEPMLLITQGRYEFDQPQWDQISREAKHLVSKLIVVDPAHRYSSAQCLQHPWITGDTLAPEDDQAESDSKEAKKEEEEEEAAAEAVLVSSPVPSRLPTLTSSAPLAAPGSKRGSAAPAIGTRGASDPGARKRARRSPSAVPPNAAYRASDATRGQECKYGRQCFRKNPLHFTEYAHPWLLDDDDKQVD